MYGGDHSQRIQREHGEISSVIELWEAGEPSVMSAPLVGALPPASWRHWTSWEFVPAPDQIEEEELPEETSGLDRGKTPLQSRQTDGA